MKTPSSIPEALKKRVRLKKDCSDVQNYLNDEYQKIILEILKNSDEWMSLHVIWRELFRQGFVLRDEYDWALNDVDEALNNLVKRGKCRISGDYECWHFNEEGRN